MNVQDGFVCRSTSHGRRSREQWSRQRLQAAAVVGGGALNSLGKSEAGRQAGGQAEEEGKGKGGQGRRKAGEEQEQTASKQAVREVQANRKQQDNSNKHKRQRKKQTQIHRQRRGQMRDKIYGM